MGDDLEQKICLAHQHVAFAHLRPGADHFLKILKVRFRLAGQPNKGKNLYRIAKGFRIKRAADVDKVLTQAQEHTEGPCVIDAEVVKEMNVFPMIPAGAAVSEMIIEKPKHRMEKPQGST